LTWEILHLTISETNTIHRRRFPRCLGKEADGTRNAVDCHRVLAPLLFNSYANDQSKPKGAERFIYADLCLATQSHDFSEIESTLSRYVELVHYDANHFRANPIKTELCAFHLGSRDTWRMLSIQWENAHVQ